MLSLVRTSSADRSTPPRPRAAMARGLRTAGFEEVVEVPLADGGEGTLDALLAARGGSRRTATVTGPLGEPVDAEWARLPDGTAVIEMARASGLALVDGTTRSAAREHARHRRADRRRGARAGATRIIVVRRRQRDDRRRARRGRGARLVARRARRGGRVRRRRRRSRDAAEVYGPQKGASAAQVALLTRRLEQLAGVYQQRTGVDVTEIEGGGAAGGLAGGLAALGARLEPGLRRRRAGRRARGRVRRRRARGHRRGQARRHELRGQGRRRRARVGGRRRESPHRAVIVGQATDAAREEASVLGDVQVLALTDRVWQAGEAFARAATARRGSRGRSRPRTASSAASTRVTGVRPRLSGQLAAVLPAVRRDGDRSAAARAPRPATASGSKSSVKRSELGGVGSIGDEPGAAQRGDEDRGRLRAELGERTVAVLAHAEVDLRGRARCRTARRRRRAAPNSTPQPSTNGSVSSTSRRPAYSPESGCTKRASCGNSVEMSGRAIELGHAAAALGLVVQRPPVEALHERDVGLGEQRAEQPGDEVLAEVADVGVEPAEEVALGRVERLPHRVALARAGPGLGQHVGDARPPGRPPTTATAAVESVDPSSMHERPRRRGRPPPSACGGRWRRCDRRWPPRSGPAGTPRPSGPVSLGLGQVGRVGSRHGARARGAAARGRG